MAMGSYLDTDSDEGPGVGAHAPEASSSTCTS